MVTGAAGVTGLLVVRLVTRVLTWGPGIGTGPAQTQPQSSKGTTVKETRPTTDHAAPNALQVSQIAFFLWSVSQRLRST